ncbi:TonB-dependent receptor plug domain-containing protein [candidate division KSB1 bacterium]|nr:TonB-dependent receptor plug domain-containing protein [candidate division KSB1 bacterium]
MKRLNWLILSIFIISTTASAKNVGTISGTVLDARTKQPLVAVNVRVLDTERGAITDLDGNYTISNVPVGTYRLKFEYIGYSPVLKTDIVVKSARPAFVNAELTETVIEGEEVTVTAGYFVEEEKIQPSTIGLSREEIRRFPGGFEDVVRTVSTLPGVAINAAGGRNDLLVRGGGPSENLYIINNIEVPNINHFGSQGNSSGSLSFVNLDFVEDVTFSTGGFGAQYGDKMSSVLNLKMNSNIPENIETKLTVSATQYGLDFETPIRNSGNLIFSARQSYLDIIFRAAGLPFVPVYTDFNLIANYDISPRDKLFVLGLGAINSVDRDQSTLENRVTNAGILDNTQNQWITGINYRRLLENGYLDATLNMNVFQYRFSQINEFREEYFNSKADEIELNFKLQHYWILSKKIGLRSGISLKNIFNDNSTAFADTIYDRSGNRVPVTAIGVPQFTDINATGLKAAYFSEIDWLVSSKLNVNAGIRLDYYDFIENSFYLAPRLSMKYKLDSKNSLRLSGGIYYQSPSYVWVVNKANEKLNALRNDMGVLGWDYLIENDLRLLLEGYYKNYSDLPTGIIPGVTDYLIVNNTGTGFGGRDDDFQSFGYYTLVSEGKGRAYGAELSLQKKFSDTPYYGQLSVSYGKSRFTANNGTTYPGQYDQRFIFNLTGGYIFNDKWEVAGKFRYFTGVPFTPIYKPNQNPINPGEIQNLPQEYLSARTEAGHHLDIRVDRYFNIGSNTLIVYLDIQNIYDFKIPQRPTYDFWENRIVDSSDIGILPSIGISFEF